MRSVLVANSSEIECDRIRKGLTEEFHVLTALTPEEASEHEGECDVVLLDQNFAGHSGIDYLKKLLKKSYVPVLMVTSPDDSSCAVEAMNLGAFNYIVKTVDYIELLSCSVKEAVERANEHEEMKQTIVALKRRVAELEERLALGAEGIAEGGPAQKKMSLLDVIAVRFRRGEINLPAYPQINIRFRRMVNAGASIAEVAGLLKQDVGISSKLITVSNSPYYCGVKRSVTLEQAITRLGLKTTKNYVEIISNRSLYTTCSRKYNVVLKELWEHALACAYGSEVLAKRLQLKRPEEVFTMGLFHDIGKLVLLQVAVEMEAKGSLGEELNRGELYETMNAYHGPFGGSLLRRWGFPEEYIFVARYHDSVEDAETVSKELLVVHLSNLISKVIGYDGGRAAEGVRIEDVVSTRFLKVPMTEIQKVMDEVKELMRNSSFY